MPVEKQLPQTQYVDLDSKDFKFGQTEIDDAYALNVVQQLFPIAENYRSTCSHDQRWNTNDALFCGWKETRTWEGTTIPRASIGIPISFDQIEAALPVIYSAIFAIGSDWFSVEAEPGTDPKEARQLQDAMNYIMEHCRDNYSSSVKPEINLAVLDLLVHGNGGLTMGWDSARRRPFVRWIDLRNLYIDPGCQTPDIEDCRFAFERNTMSVQEIQDLRQNPAMNIPDDGILQALAKAGPPNVIADQTKRMQEAFRGIQWNPGNSDYTPVPMDRKIEVLIYYSKTRIVWVLNRQIVIYNGPNPYGFYPFVFAPCYIYASRFYALSMADVQEGNQRIIEGLVNGRLDEISLAIRPPRIAKRGILMTPSQQKWHPGMVYQADDPKHMELFQPQNNLANIYAEVEYFDKAAEKRTGVNSMAQGVPRGGNVNRTATGVQSQTNAANAKLQNIVSNIEDYMILPLLYKLYKIMQFNTNPEDQLPTSGSNKVPAYLFQKPIQFKMNAASRMISRQELMQIFPFVTQYLLNGQFLGMLEQGGNTLNFDEYYTFFQDCTGVSKRYNFVRPITPEEQQQKQQQQEQNPETIKQKQDYELEKEKNDIAREKNQIDAQKGLPNPQEMQIEELKAKIEMQKMQMEAQLEKDKAQQEMIKELQMGKIKIQAEQEKLQVKREESQMKMQAKSQELAMSMKSQMLQSQMDIANQQRQSELDAIMGQQNIRHAEEQHQQSLKHEKVSGEQSLKLKGEEAKLKAKSMAAKPKPSGKPR